MPQAMHYRDFLCSIFGLCFVLAYILDDLDCVMTFALLVESVHNYSRAPYPLPFQVCNVSQWVWAAGYMFPPGINNLNDSTFGEKQDNR